MVLWKYSSNVSLAHLIQSSNEVGLMSTRARFRAPRISACVCVCGGVPTGTQFDSRLTHRLYSWQFSRSLNKLWVTKRRVRNTQILSSLPPLSRPSLTSSTGSRTHQAVQRGPRTHSWPTAVCAQWHLESSSEYKSEFLSLRRRNGSSIQEVVGMIVIALSFLLMMSSFLLMMLSHLEGLETIRSSL